MTSVSKPREKRGDSERNIETRWNWAGRITAGAVTLLALLGAAQAQPQPQGYRIFISVDMEGVAGAVSPKQISVDGADYAATRRIMTDELLAAMDGARKAGATEFVVTDGHGDGQNLLLDELPPDARLIRGSPMPLQMMQGIGDGRFDGAIFIGYHAGAGSLSGVRAHTFSSARLSDVRLNGVSVSEGYFNAAVAGEHGIPVLVVSGDEATVDELRPVLKSTRMVAVKRQVAYHAAEMIAPAKAQQLIREAAEQAVRDRSAARPLRLSHPISVDVAFHFYRPAEVLSWAPGFQRVDAHTVRFEAADADAAMRTMAFILSYDDALEP